MHLSYNKRISKRALQQLIKGSVMTNTKTLNSVQAKVITEFLPCENVSCCEIASIRPDYCSDFCDKRIKIVKEEEAPVKLTETKYLDSNYKSNKNVIKQYLLYHFLLCGVNNVRKKIKVKDIAKYLNITTTTVKTNNLILSQLGLVHFSNIYGNENDIIIVNEDKLHLKKSSIGGYLTLTLKELKIILGSNTISELRAEIANLLMAEGIKKFKSKNVTFESLQKYFPSYMQKNKDSLKNLLTKCNLISVTEKEDSENVFVMSKYNSAARVKLIKEKLKDKWSQFMFSKELSIFDKFFPEGFLDDMGENLKKSYRNVAFSTVIKDLTQLSLEFTFTHVKEQLININEFYENEKIENIGALIRSRIESLLKYDGSNSTLVKSTDKALIDIVLA